MTTSISSFTTIHRVHLQSSTSIRLAIERPPEPRGNRRNTRKMASRRSARTSTNRNQASSPPLLGPVARRARTRSESVELRNAETTTRRGKRNPRQATVENVSSDSSAAPSSRGGRRKVPRGRAYPGKRITTLPTYLNSH